MLNVPDELLRNGLRLYSEAGHELDDAIRMATSPYIFSGRSAFQTWLAAVAEHGEQDWIADNCFRWVFTSGAWPMSSPLSRAVGRSLAFEETPAGAVSRALFDAERRATERRIAASWCQRAAYLYRPGEVIPHLPILRYVASNDSTLRGLARWVASGVRYVTDTDNWGCPDFWQSPGVTLQLGMGDCEDSALLVWSTAPLLDLPTGRLAIGTHSGQGHAWVEFPELGLFVEATNGQVGRMSSTGFLAFYKPWLWAYADGSCELARG